MGQWILCATVAIWIAGYFGWLAFYAYHYHHGPNGYVHVLQRVESEMRQAHETGRHADVVRLYETPTHVRWDSDLTLANGEIAHDIAFSVGESYDRTGDDEAARRHYLYIVGWSEMKYLSFCRLAIADCDDPDALRSMAAGFLR